MSGGLLFHVRPTACRDAGHPLSHLQGILLDHASVSKQYGRTSSALLALDRVSLTARRGEFVCLLGASGCHRVSLMFQEAALFPWLSVSGNVEIALRLRGVGRQERKERADQLLETAPAALMLTGRPVRRVAGLALV